MGNFKSELKGLDRFQPIPRDLIQDCGLSAQARFVYSYMAAKPEGWEFWQDVMSREVGMSVATLRKYLYELRDAGWLEIGKQNHNVKGFGSVQYILKAIPYANFCDTQKTCSTNFMTHENCDTQNLSHLDNIDNQDIHTSLKKKEGSKAPANQLNLPFDSQKFLDTWAALLEEKAWKKKTKHALQLQLNKMAQFDEEFVIMLMERTIESGKWEKVVYDNTFEKYQEWQSERQRKIDNEQPRTSQQPQVSARTLATIERLAKMREQNHGDTD